MRWYAFPDSWVRLAAYDAEARRLLLGIHADRDRLRGYRFENVPLDWFERILDPATTLDAAFARSTRDRFEHEHCSADRFGGLLSELYGRGFTKVGLSYGDPAPKLIADLAQMPRDEINALFDTDAECAGNHEWLLVAPPGAQVAEIYHLNSDTLQVLPPTPRVARWPDPR